MILDLLNWGLKLGVVTTGLIGLALLLRRPLARYWGAEAAYLIWALPFLRLFMPDIRLPIKQKLSVWEWPEITAVPLPAEPVETLEAPVATTAQSTPLGLDLSALPILIVGIWLSVGLTWFVWQLYKHVRYWRLLNHVCLPVNDEIANVMARAAKIVGLQAMPRLKRAPAQLGPMVSGTFRPLIIVPQNFTDHFTPKEQLFALSHEAAHIKRGDLWVAVALLFFRAVHWYNPLVHYAARRFRIDQEAACDAFILARMDGRDMALGYAKALIKAEQASGIGAHKGQALSLAMVDKPEGKS